MTEKAPTYEIGRTLCKPWKCRECGHKLGMVVAGSMYFKGRVELRPKVAIVECPKCGAGNIWPPKL